MWTCLPLAFIYKWGAGRHELTLYIQVQNLENCRKPTPNSILTGFSYFVQKWVRFPPSPPERCLNTSSSVSCCHQCFRKLWHQPVVMQEAETLHFKWRNVWDSRKSVQLSKISGEFTINDIGCYLYGSSGFKLWIRGCLLHTDNPPVEHKHPYNAQEKSVKMKIPNKPLHIVYHAFRLGHSQYWFTAQINTANMISFLHTLFFLIAAS